MITICRAKSDPRGAYRCPSSRGYSGNFRASTWQGRKSRQITRLAERERAADENIKQHFAPALLSRAGNTAPGRTTTVAQPGGYYSRRALPARPKPPEFRLKVRRHPHPQRSTSEKVLVAAVIAVSGLPAFVALPLLFLNLVTSGRARYFSSCREHYHAHRRYKNDLAVWHHHAAHLA